MSLLGRNLILNMMMKKHLLLLCLTMAATSSIAQINPQRGFVITNGNDTIHGTIDYRSDTKNGRECLFKEDGHTSYQSYKPGEIKEYQLKNENICYVTRTFPVGGSEKTVFAEYLVQEGDISLFHHREGNVNYFYMVDASGKVAVMNDAVLSAGKREQQANLLGAIQMLQASPQAVQQLQQSQLKPKKLMNAIHTYFMDTHRFMEPDVEGFRYNEQTAAGLKCRLALDAGVGFTRVHPDKSIYNFANDLTMKGVVPQVGVGVDVTLPRFSKSFFMEGKVLLSYWNVTGMEKVVRDVVVRVDAWKDEFDAKMKYANAEALVGAGWRFLPDSRIRPFIRAGVSLNLLLGVKQEEMSSLLPVESDSWGGVGLYGGVGAEMSVGKHVISLFVNYVLRSRNELWTRSNTTCVGLGYLF